MISRRSRFFLALLFTALPHPSVAADLKIMAEDAAEPFSRADGTGYANDVVRAAFHAAGVEIQFDVVPYARCKKDVEDGKVAACFSMSWYMGVEDAVAFSDIPVIQVYADVFLNRNSPSRFARIADIGKGAMVGIVNQYEYPDAIYGLRRQGAVLQLAPNDGANLQMLARGRLDAAIVMTNDLVPTMQKALDSGVGSQVAYAFRAGVEKGYVGFSKKNAGGELARQQFNTGYKKIIADGTVETIRRKWTTRAAP
jgi:ABC-type amino acid transport substrate-binding protein